MNIYGKIWGENSSGMDEINKVGRFTYKFGRISYQKGRISDQDCQNLMRNCRF